METTDTDTENCGGDSAAMLAEGQRLMAKSATAERGTRLILEAAHAGNGEAAHLISLIVAADHTVAERWTYALAYLGRAAKAGHLRSRKVLAFLAGEDAMVEDLVGGAKFDDQTCHRLHDRINLDAWLNAPSKMVVSTAPYIALAKGLIDTRTCNWIIEQARPRLQRALVYDAKDGSGVALQLRTNSEMRFEFVELDLVLMFAIERIATFSGFFFKGWEPSSVLHYSIGQEFCPHHDYLDPNVPCYAAEIAKTGQRLATILIYLSEDFEGGETEFPILRYRFKGKTGDALLFHNVTETGAPDPRTLHAGLAPTRGEKWLFSQWIRARARVA
jgi:prolyl 4-hydroxylase